VGKQSDFIARAINLPLKTAATNQVANLHTEGLWLPFGGYNSLSFIQTKPQGVYDHLVNQPNRLCQIRSTLLGGYNCRRLSQQHAVVCKASTGWPQKTWAFSHEFFFF
jgi:hypothetical protein